MARTAGLFFVAPVFSHTAVPVRLRYFASVVVAMAVTARLAAPVNVPASWIELAAGAAGEVLIGLSIALAARAVFAGVELAAVHVSRQMGLSLGRSYDSRGGAGDPVAGVFGLVALVIFLSLGGHRVVIAALLGTFRNVPLLGFEPGGEMLEMVAAVLGASFVLALRIAAPVLVAVLMATAALGLLHKTMPAFNTFSTGLPARAILGLAVLAISLAAVAPLLDEAIGMLERQMTALIEGLG